MSFYPAIPALGFLAIECYTSLTQSNHPDGTPSHNVQVTLEEERKYKITRTHVFSSYDPDWTFDSGARMMDHNRVTIVHPFPITSDTQVQFADLNFFKRLQLNQSDHYKGYIAWRSVAMAVAIFALNLLSPIRPWITALGLIGASHFMKNGTSLPRQAFDTLARKIQGNTPLQQTLNGSSRNTLCNTAIYLLGELKTQGFIKEPDLDDNLIHVKMEDGKKPTDAFRLYEAIITHMEDRTMSLAIEAGPAINTHLKLSKAG